MPPKKKKPVDQFIEIFGYKPHGNNKKFKALKKQYNVNKINTPKQRNEFLIKVIDDKQKFKPATIISKFFKKNFERNKIFRSKPSKSSFNSYNQYTINNSEPYLFTKFVNVGDDILEVFEIETVQSFMNFYKIEKFLKEKSGSKIWLEGIYLQEDQNGKEIIYVEKNVTTKSIKVLSGIDIMEIMNDFYRKTTELHFSYKSSIKRLLTLNIHVANVNPLTASSYIELPPNIKNKNAIINIKNNDNLCFLYSVLCGLDTPKKNADRVSNYSKRLNELKWNKDEMPMDIHKVMYFEKRNNIRINIFGLEGKLNQVIPLYTSCQKTKNELPLIHLLYYKPEGTDGHYCYIKNFNRLMSNKSTSKNDHHQNLVCPYCCEFTAKGGSGKVTMEKHISQCISTQKVKIPKIDTIKFKHFNNINECPIRIYADFEALNDSSSSHKSKNEMTIFKTTHKPASFGLLVVSDIPIEGYEVVNNTYIKYYIHKGLDSSEEFVKLIIKLEEELSDIIDKSQYKNKYKFSMTEKEKQEHKSCNYCWVCNGEFTTENKKVKHHCHNTGKYHSTICNNCNLQIKDTIKIPVFFHNLNYDKNIFFSNLILWCNEEKNKNIKILPNNTQNFKSFQVGKLNFLDSFAFMSSGLGKLIDNVPDESKHYLKHISKTDEIFKIMKMKGQFPYEWFDNIDKLKWSIDELKKEHFDSSLNLSSLDDKEWEDVKYIIDKMKIKSFENYHDFYLNIDVYGLADVFENFRKTSLKYYKLDPCHYVGCPSFAWDAMLLKTKIELQLLKDSDMYLFFERGIRGGQSVIFNKFAEANNQYMEEYNENLEKSFISYLDANNLYGHSMSRPLPYKNFKWVEPLTEEFILNYNEDSDIGYTLEVDLEYPKHLHDLHNDYPLAPEKYTPKGSACDKLCGTFFDKKDYVIDIRNLKFYLQKGLLLKKVSRVVQYNQKKWLKEWIDLNTNFRKEAKNEFEKDYFKLMNNSVFGKTMENVRNRIQVECCFEDGRQKHLQSKINYLRTKPFHNENNSFSIVELNQNIVKLDKPIYAGFTILDLSKLHMYDFHYNVMKPKYGDNIELLMTDTDSFVYKIKTDDFYKDMYDMRDYYDMSEYSKDCSLYDSTNKKVLGKFKDETPNSIITDFIGIRSKCYTIRTNEKLIKKSKGVSKKVVEKNIDFIDYKNCVMENKDIYRSINSIRTSNMTNYSITQNKLALSNKDDKRVWEGTKSRAYGHWRN